MSTMMICRATSGQTEEYGEFLHQPGKIYTDFTEIREEIVKETGIRYSCMAHLVLVEDRCLRAVEIYTYST